MGMKYMPTGKKEIAIIIYGDGRELGDFKIFADHHKKELGKKYSSVILRYINRDFDFFKLLETIPKTQKIAELHIYTHSIGAGLFLGYKDPAIAKARENIWKKATYAGRNVTYKEVVDTEIGAIQTDDLVFGKYLSKRADYRAKFNKGGFIKVWGCNAGVNNWVYSDSGVTDPKDTSEPYYWRAFNEKHIPKSSIAKALAMFFNVKVYGARSGSSIEVKYKKNGLAPKIINRKLVIGHQVQYHTG
jgi:hypothetical protein